MLVDHVKKVFSVDVESKNVTTIYAKNNIQELLKIKSENQNKLELAEA